MKVCSRKIIVLCAFLSLVFVGGIKPVEASFEGAWTQLQTRLLRQHLIRSFHGLSADIYRLQRVTTKAGLPPEREKKLQDVLACMTTFASVQQLRRRQPGTYRWSWYWIRVQLRYMKYQLKTLKQFRKSYHSCLVAMQAPTRMGQQLQVTVVRQRAQHKLRLYEDTYTKLKHSYNKLKTWHLQIKAMKDRSYKNPNAAGYLKLSRSQVLYTQQLLLGLQQRLLKVEWSRPRRIRSLKILWQLAPNPTQTPLPINTMVPLAMTMGTMMVSLMGGLGAIAASEDAEDPATAEKAGMILTGITSTSLLALSPVSMINTPQPVGLNVFHTLLSVAVIPAVGIALTQQDKPELQHLGYGVLGALPLQLTWLTIGWINQSRWARIKQEWKTPRMVPPPNWHMNDGMETKMKSQGLRKPTTSFQIIP